jgi:hypothetical protein
LPKRRLVVFRLSLAEVSFKALVVGIQKIFIYLLTSPCPFLISAREPDHGRRGIAIDLGRDNTGPLAELKTWIRDDGRPVAEGTPDKRNDQVQSSLISERLRRKHFV